MKTLCFLPAYRAARHSRLRSPVEFTSDGDAAQGARWMLADDPQNTLIEIQGGDVPTYMIRGSTAPPFGAPCRCCGLTTSAADCPTDPAYPSSSSAVERPPRLKRSGPSMRALHFEPRDMSIHIAIAGFTVLVALAAPLIISIADALKPDARRARALACPKPIL